MNYNNMVKRKVSNLIIVALILLISVLIFGK